MSRKKGVAQRLVTSRRDVVATDDDGGDDNDDNSCVDGSRRIRRKTYIVSLCLSLSLSLSLPLSLSLSLFPWRDISVPKLVFPPKLRAMVCRGERVCRRGLRVKRAFERARLRSEGKRELAETSIQIRESVSREGESSVKTKRTSRLFLVFPSLPAE